jgi:hypothetical protein
MLLIHASDCSTCPSSPPRVPIPQGYLEFDSLNKVDVLLRELPDSYASKQAARQLGVDLCFCYANPIPGGRGRRGRGEPAWWRGRDATA